jgi:hypothetical protein
MLALKSIWMTSLGDSPGSDPIPPFFLDIASLSPQMQNQLERRPEFAQQDSTGGVYGFIQYQDVERFGDSLDWD